MDVMTLVLTGRVEQRRREFGPVVRDLLRGDPLDPGERQLLAGGPGAGELPERTVLLLTWLHHAASNLQKRNHLPGEHGLGHHERPLRAGEDVDGKRFRPGLATGIRAP